MKSHPTFIAPRFLCAISFAFLIIISCSKDNEIFDSKVLTESEVTTEEPTNESSEDEKEKKEVTTEEIVEEEDVIEIMVEKIYETRTTIFPAINDAHLQGDTGYNQNIVRLEEGRRTSYLMFDLSPIDSIGGNINTNNLEFTIDSDDGNGTISVFKAVSNEWSEEKLSAKNAPKTEVLVGELATRYEVGQTQEIALDTALIYNEVLSLVLIHQEGNDLAFASKEHPSGKGPVLVVTYDAPQDAEAIVFEDETEISLQANAPSETTEDEVSDEDEVNEESSDTEQENTEEQSTDEETAEDVKEESQDEDTPEEEIADEEPTSEEETASEEESQKEEAADEEQTSEEESTDETEQEDQIEDTKEEEIMDEESTSEDESTDETEQEEEKSGEENEETTDEEESNNEPDAPTNESPIAVAEASPSTGDAPLKVTFKGNNSNDDLGVKNYVWDFRDGSTSTEANPTHTFEKTGTLEVRLTVTDDQGASHTDTVTITINEKEENEAPKAVASADPTSGEAALEVQFRGNTSSDDNEIKTYFWDFKDGSTSTNSNPSHSFSKAGTYKVELSVTDEEGLTDSETVTIVVSEKENKAPKAVASGLPLTGDAPLEVDFKALNSTDDNEVTGYFWDFKDGSTTTSKNPSHTFSEAGEYEVELSVKDAEGLTDATTVKVMVNQRPADNGGGDSDNGGDDNNGGNDSGSDNENGGNDNGGNDNSGNYPSNAVFASSFGFKSGDATSAFEAAIKSGSSYVVIDRQSSDWVIRPTRFFNLRNMTIVFESGVTLRAKPGAFSEGKRLFEMVGANNVTVEGNGATFKMNRNEYTSGQQRHAFSINNCDGITVRGLTIRDSGGAGIMIYGGGGSGYSKNITVENVRSLNNKRDGITVVSAENVSVRNSEFSGSNGSRPEAGVVLEPDNPNERLVNINFSNCKFAGNNGSGVHFGVYGQNSGSRPVSVKIVDSEFSNNALSVPSGKSASEVVIGGGRGAPLGGEVRFERAKFNGSRGRVYFSRKSGDGFKVVFKDCEARNVVTGIDGSPIVIEAENTRNSFGGAEFDNFYIQYDRNVPFMAIKAPKEFNGTINKLKNVKANFTVREPGDNPVKYLWGYNQDANVNVSINYEHK